MRVRVTWGSKLGGTAGIADTIATELRARGICGFLLRRPSRRADVQIRTCRSVSAARRGRNSTVIATAPAMNTAFHTR